MGSASMLLASSGHVADDLCASCKSYELCARDPNCVADWLANAIQSEQKPRSPIVESTFRVPARGSRICLVLLGDEVFGAAR